MATLKTLSALSPDHQIVEFEIVVSRQPPGEIVLTASITGEARFSGFDRWACLTALRLHLEPLGYLLLCNGARIDVYPSGLTRSFGGNTAYINRMGLPSNQEDRVYIFDYAPPETVGTVQQQKEFHQRWWESLGLRPVKRDS